MKILILVLAVTSFAQGTLLKTLARSSRGFGGSAPYAPAVERAVEVGESQAFGSREALGNRQYLPPGPPSPAYIPPREAPQATHPAPSFVPPQNNYLPPQPAPAQPAPNYLPPQQPQPNYLPPPQISPVAPSPNYLPPQPHTAPSQGHGIFAQPQRPQNSYIPPAPPSPQYGAPAQPQPHFAAPAPNYLPPNNPPAQNYLPPQGFPEQTAPAPNFAPAPSYLPPSQNYLPPAASNLAGAFDSQSGYSYQAPNTGFFGGDNFGNAGGFDSHQVNNEYLPPQEHAPEPAPESFPVSSAESEGFSEAISGGEGSAEHIEEHPAPIAPAPAPIAPAPAPVAPAAENIKTIRVITENAQTDTVKTVKVITEPTQSTVDEAVKTIRVITEHRPSPVAAVHAEDNVKVIRVIHENNAPAVDTTKILRVISDGATATTGVSPAQVLRFINDAPVAAPALETSKVVRIVSDGGSSALSAGGASSVLNLLSGGVTSTFGGVSEVSTGIADAPSKILRIVSDSGLSSSAGDFYGTGHAGQDHVKVVKVLSGGSAISTPSNLVRVLASGASPSYYSSSASDIYGGYGHGSLRILQKRDSSNTAVNKKVTEKNAKSS